MKKDIATTNTYAKLLIRTGSKSAKNLCHPDETEFQSNWLEMVEQRILGLFAMVTVVSSPLFYTVVQL